MLHLLAATLLVSQSVLQAQSPASVYGRWKTDDHKAVVTIGACGPSLCGRISKVLDKVPAVPETDINNPNPDMRNRPIIGLPVLSGFKRDGREWTGGRAYDPKTGNSYRAKLALNEDGSLKVTGCILFVCRSKRWTREP